MRIYLVAMIAYRADRIFLTAKIIRATNGSEAKGISLESAYVTWPKDNGYYGHLIGPVDDITDKIRSVLQEIDAA